MPMDAKTYLGQAYRIDQRINSKLEQIVALRELATKATSTLNDTSVSGSRNLQSMEGIIAKMIDMEDEIKRDIDTLVDLKREFVTIIKKINNPEYQTLLELRYLCFKTWEQIAVDMGYSLQHIFRIHAKALKDVVLSKEESKCDRIRV